MIATVSAMICTWTALNKYRSTSALSSPASRSAGESMRASKYSFKKIPGITMCTSSDHPHRAKKHDRSLQPNTSEGTDDYATGKINSLLKYQLKFALSQVTISLIESSGISSCAQCPHPLYKWTVVLRSSAARQTEAWYGICLEQPAPPWEQLMYAGLRSNNTPSSTIYIQIWPRTWANFTAINQNAVSTAEHNICMA